jgi:hypothetical protein
MGFQEKPVKSEKGTGRSGNPMEDCGVGKLWEKKREQIMSRMFLFHIPIVTSERDGVCL